MGDPQKEAQLIPGSRLYLGPRQVAHDAQRLQQLGVTKVMSVLAEDQGFDQVAVEGDNKVWVHVEDSVEAEDDMARELPSAVEQLVRWDAEAATTLVHCQE